MINKFINATSLVPLDYSMGDCARYSGELVMTVEQKNNLEGKKQTFSYQLVIKSLTLSPEKSLKN